MALVYCSGPLFSPEEQAAMSALAATLEQAGHGTFLPQRDGLEPALFLLMKAPGAASRWLNPAPAAAGRAVFALDVYQLVERCEALVINLNGRVPDEGAVVEMAIAFSTGKAVVAYKHDARAPFLGLDNPMLTGLVGADATVSRLEEVPAAVTRATRRARPLRLDALPEALRDALALGRRIWAVWSRLPRRHWPDADVAAVAGELERLGAL